VVLVLPGTYAGLANVTNKTLSVVGLPDAGGARPQIETLAVKNIHPGQTVLVRGLASGPTTAAFLLVLNCTGPVLVEDCSFSQHLGPSLDADDAVIVKDSARIVFARCTLQGAPGHTAPSLSAPGGPALFCSNSVVTLDACTVAVTARMAPFTPRVWPSSPPTSEATPSTSRPAR
jgi:hypothetical protein